MNLRQFRKSKNWTQAEIALLLGITQAHFSDVETGKKNPSPSLAASLENLGYEGEWEVWDSDMVELPILEMSASAGRGILNFEDYPAATPLLISPKALGLDSSELKGCFGVQARGRSMSPAIDNGDLLFVRPLPEVPRYLEGVCLVNYDGELYVKSIQWDYPKLTMKSINKEFADIVVYCSEDSDVNVQIMGRVLLVIKRF